MLDTSSLKPWQRFHVRLTLWYGLVVVAVLLVMSIVIYRYAASRELDNIRQRLLSTATGIASGVSPATIEGLRDPAMQDSPEQKVLLDRLRVVAQADPDISDIYVFRPSDKPGVLIFVADHIVRAAAAPGKIGEEYIPKKTIHMLDAFERPTVEQDPYTDEWGTVLSGYAPIRDSAGKAVAIVGIDIQIARVNEIKSRVRWLTILLFAGSTLALLVLAKIVAVSIREPLYKIVEASSAITSGAPSVRVGSNRKDEFGLVGRHFDVMANGLEERDFIKATFGTYVSHQVVRKLLDERKDAVFGEQRNVVVMFSDLRSFTTLTEKLAPSEIVAMLNDYLERMSQAVVGTGGRIDKFIGDALMADWGALEPIENAEECALHAVLEMQRALSELNVGRRERGEMLLRMGIGLHSGSVIAGSIGSQRKLEFTIIGDAVNAASRLEGLCKLYSADIIASREVISAVAKPPAHRRLDRVIVAGKSEPIEIVEVLAENDPRVARIATYERGIDAFYAQRWDDAIALFDEAAADLAERDPVVAFQRERAVRLKAAPPGTGWDGIERRTK